MINILFVHQSAELYGSDKTLLLLLKHLDKSKYNATVIIPFDGPLKNELEKEQIRVVIAPVLKLYRKIFSPKNIVKFFKDIKKGFSIIDALHAEHKFNLIYSNTLAVLLGIFYAKQRKIKHLWHVHEIIESPTIFQIAFVKLLSVKANTKIVCNSIATQKFWNQNAQISIKSEVVWNGLENYCDIFSTETIEENRKLLFNANKNETVIALVGRISRWKGQLLLLNAFKLLSENNRNIKLAFVGAPPPQQDFFLNDLVAEIQRFNLSAFVKIISFQPNIYKVWQSVDIAIVPSIEPEPFGLVAVEAMLSRKPVVAANHGGLQEIVINNKTGFLFEPNNEIALAAAIQKLLDNPELRLSFGNNGHQRVLETFSIENHTKQFENIFQKLI